METLKLNTNDFIYTISCQPGIGTEHYAANSRKSSWVLPNLCQEFILQINNQLYSSNTAEFKFLSSQTLPQKNGSLIFKITSAHQNPDFQVDTYFRTFPQTTVLEKWSTVINKGKEPLEITRFDTFGLRLPSGVYELRYFKSGWGQEFSPVVEPLTGTKILEGISGRSSAMMHPWFYLYNQERGNLAGTLAWSGNWIYRFEPQGDQGYLITGGINPWLFKKILSSGEKMEGLPVLTALGKDADLDEPAFQFRHWGKKYGYPQNTSTQNFPLLWNSWWPYTDTYINEQVFRENVDLASELGFEVCLLDAGWFGTTEEPSRWVYKRGDWDIVNPQRFPSGMKALSDYVHQKGIKFGLWCEIEAVSNETKLKQKNPRILAQRDGNFLLSICLGSSETYHWALTTLRYLIREYKIDWLKIDYNLDVGAGCNRTDHGHGSGDGLYAHYQTFYQLLKQLGQEFPELIIESCSSGGLRLDLGLAQQTHCSYLSDPDLPVHSLQVFWGATSLLSPAVCLHWPWSYSIEGFAGLDLTQEGIDPARLDYYFRIGMLNLFGLAHPLPKLPPSRREKIKDYLKFYKEKIRPFVLQADFYRLSGQPLGEGGGDRWSVFEYLNPNKKQGLVFVFRLPGAEPQRTIYLKGLLPEQEYQLTNPDQPDYRQQKSGEELMREGLSFTGLAEETSVLIFLEVLNG